MAINRLIITIHNRKCNWLTENAIESPIIFNQLRQLINRLRKLVNTCKRNATSMPAHSINPKHNQQMPTTNANFKTREIDWKWNRYGAVVCEKRSRDEPHVSLALDRSELDVALKWTRRDIEVKSKCDRSAMKTWNLEKLQSLVCSPHFLVNLNGLIQLIHCFNWLLIISSVT